MKKYFAYFWIPLACFGVMLLTASLILVFYATIAFRKLFLRDYTPHARKGMEPDDEDVIGSAQSHLNAIQATLDKTETNPG